MAALLCAKSFPQDDANCNTFETNRDTARSPTEQEKANAALQTLTYLSKPDWNGFDNITITANDNGNSGEGGAKEDTQTIPIFIAPLNDPAALSGPLVVGTAGKHGRVVRRATPLSTLTLEEEGEVHLPGCAVHDAEDDNDSIYEVVITAKHGLLGIDHVGVHFHGVTSANGKVDGSYLEPTNKLNITGPLVAVNQKLERLTYFGAQDYNSHVRERDTVDFTVRDFGSLTNPSSEDYDTALVVDTMTLSLTICPVNDAPRITVAQTSFEGEEDELLFIAMELQIEVREGREIRGIERSEEGGREGDESKEREKVGGKRKWRREAH